MTTRIRRALAATALATVALTGVTFATAGPASAAGTYINNPDPLAGVPACGAIGCPYGPGYILPDGSTFTMRCWADGYGERWFQGNQALVGPGRVWIKARYVYNQIAVGHC